MALRNIGNYAFATMLEDFAERTASIIKIEELTVDEISDLAELIRLYGEQKKVKLSTFKGE